MLCILAQCVHNAESDSAGAIRFPVRPKVKFLLRSTSTIHCFFFNFSSVLFPFPVLLVVVIHVFDTPSDSDRIQIEVAATIGSVAVIPCRVPRSNPPAVIEFTKNGVKMSIEDSRQWWQLDLFVFSF